MSDVDVLLMGSLDNLVSIDKVLGIPAWIVEGLGILERSTCGIAQYCTVLLQYVQSIPMYRSSVMSADPGQVDEI